jgi:hypothetical protein
MKSIVITINLILICLFATITVQGQNPTLRLRGQVFQTSGPVIDHELRIRFFSNDPIDTTVYTDINGRYQISKELVNNSTDGVFSFILEDCDKKIITKTKNWNSTQGYDVEEDIEICVDTSGACSVRIVILPNPSGGYNLVAVSNDAAKYEWSTGQTSRNILVQLADIYCVTVTDINGCRSTDCINVNSTDVQNCGVSISLRYSPDPRFVKMEAIAKGSGNYSIKWSTGDTTQIIDVSQPGRYCVFLTDLSTGCQDSACFDVRSIHFGQGTDCSVWFSVQNFGGTQYILRALNNRPQDPVRYRWSTGDTTQMIQVIGPGIYCVTATFSDGCVDEFCGPVLGVNPSQCMVDIHTELLDPVLGLWRVTAVPIGNNFVSINWSNGAQTPSTELLGPATICLSVVYDNGCRARKCLKLPEGSITFRGEMDHLNKKVIIYPNPVMESIYIKLDDTASNKNDRSLELVIFDLNGKPVLTRRENTKSNQLELNIKGLIPGTYWLSIFDGNERSTYQILKE